MHDQNGICTAAVGSVTHAERAKSLLARAAIRARVIKVSSGERYGCVYGIEVPCSQKKNVEEILSLQRLHVRQWT